MNKWRLIVIDLSKKICDELVIFLNLFHNACVVSIHKFILKLFPNCKNQTLMLDAKVTHYILLYFII